MYRSLLIFAVAFATRLFFALFAPFQAGDSHQYQQIAVNLLGGNGYAMFDGLPTTDRVPMYPLFIAATYGAFGQSSQTVLLMQSAFGAVGIWLLYDLGRRTVGEPAGFVGSLLAGAYPQLAFYSATLLTETLTSLLLIATVLLAHVAQRSSRHLTLATLAGTLGALAALSSSYLAALPLALCVMIVLVHRPIRRAMLIAAFLALGYVLGLSPWIARNVAVFGTPVALTTQGYGQSLWLAAARFDLYDYAPFFDPDLRRREPLLARHYELYQVDAHRERERIRERQELDGDFLRDAIRRIAADPTGYLAHRVRVVPALWVQPAAHAGHFRPPFERQNRRLDLMLAERDWGAAALRLASIALFTGGLYGGVVLGIWSGRKAWRDRALLYAPPLYVVALFSPTWIEHRFSVLVHPFLWLVAAAGLLWLADRARRSGVRLTATIMRRGSDAGH